jgi:hypothetical protein
MIQKLKILRGYKMKTLAKLILAAGIGLGSLSVLNCQDIPKENPVTELRYETDGYKYIPRNSTIIMVSSLTEYGVLVGIWYDKECKSVDDYQKKYQEYKGTIPPEKIFIDLNGDGIVDMSAKEVLEWCVYEKKLEKEKEAEQELEKTVL